MNFVTFHTSVLEQKGHILGPSNFFAYVFSSWNPYGEITCVSHNLGSACCVPNPKHPVSGDRLIYNALCISSPFLSGGGCLRARASSLRPSWRRRRRSSRQSMLFFHLSFTLSADRATPGSPVVWTRTNRARVCA